MLRGESLNGNWDLEKWEDVSKITRLMNVGLGRNPGILIPELSALHCHLASCSICRKIDTQWIFGDWWPHIVRVQVLSRLGLHCLTLVLSVQALNPTHTTLSRARPLRAPPICEAWIQPPLFLGTVVLHEHLPSLDCCLLYVKTDCAFSLVVVFACAYVIYCKARLFMLRKSSCCLFLHSS